MKVRDYARASIDVSSKYHLWGCSGTCRRSIEAVTHRSLSPPVVLPPTGLTVIRLVRKVFVTSRIFRSYSSGIRVSYTRTGPVPDVRNTYLQSSSSQRPASVGGLSACLAGKPERPRHPPSPQCRAAVSTKGSRQLLWQ